MSNSLIPVKHRNIDDCEKSGKLTSDSKCATSLQTFLSKSLEEISTKTSAMMLSVKSKGGRRHVNWTSLSVFVPPSIVWERCVVYDDCDRLEDWIHFRSPLRRLPVVGTWHKCTDTCSIPGRPRSRLKHDSVVMPMPDTTTGAQMMSSFDGQPMTSNVLCNW